jgi:hypothetical protein
VAEADHSKRGDLIIIKQTRHEANHSKRGALLIIKHTRHEADHSIRGALVIIKQTSMMPTTLKGSFGNYKADGV